MQGILNQQDALVRSSLSFVVLLQEQVAIDSPWSLLGCMEHASKAPPQDKAGEKGQPGGCLCKSSLQETVSHLG
jgi:hypothetical protein